MSYQPIAIVSIAPFDCPACTRTIIIDKGTEINGSFVVLSALASDDHGQMVMHSHDRFLWSENVKLSRENAQLRKQIRDQRPWKARLAGLFKR